MSDFSWGDPARLKIAGETAPKQTTLEQAVRAFAALDWERQSMAALTLDTAIRVRESGPRNAFYGDEIDALVKSLPPER